MRVGVGISGGIDGRAAENLLPREPPLIVLPMDAASLEATSIVPTEILSMDEILARYPDQWVIMVDMVQEDAQTVAGRVYAHGPDRTALVPAMMEAIQRYGGVARRWTGEYGEPQATWRRLALGIR